MTILVRPTRGGTRNTITVQPFGDRPIAFPVDVIGADPTTDICRFLDTKQWDAWNIDADFEKQHWDLTQADEVKLVESGPLRAVVRLKSHFQNSTFVRDIIVSAGSPRVDVKMTADWHEKHILLKVAMPVSAHSNVATFEIPYGTIERPTTRNTRAERSAQTREW